MSGFTPCLWFFEGDAEDALTRYVELFSAYGEASVLSASRAGEGVPRVEAGCGVGGAVVEHQHLEVAHTLGRQDRGEAGADALRLVPCGHEHAHALGDDGRGVGGTPQEAQVEGGVRGRGDRAEGSGGDERLGRAGQSRPVHSDHA